MAEVFLAKSTGAEGIEKLLVLKRILPTFASSAKFVAMFVDEAKVTGERERSQTLATRTGPIHRCVDSDRRYFLQTNPSPSLCCSINDDVLS